MRQGGPMDGKNTGKTRPVPEEGGTIARGDGEKGFWKMKANGLKAATMPPSVEKRPGGRRGTSAIVSLGCNMKLETGG